MVRTVHDPFGTGTNVLLLGGSDEQGVAAAVAWFRRQVTGRELVLPPTVHVHGVPAARLCYENRPKGPCRGRVPEVAALRQFVRRFVRHLRSGRLIR